MLNKLDELQAIHNRIATLYNTCDDSDTKYHLDDLQSWLGAVIDAIVVERGYIEAQLFVAKQALDSIHAN